jgi:hypothetical protein
MFPRPARARSCGGNFTRWIEIEKMGIDCEMMKAVN